MTGDLLAADVEALIREAQGEARAAVKARLRAQFERELTEAVDARLERAEPAGEAQGAVAPAPRGASASAPASKPAPAPVRVEEEVPARPGSEEDAAGTEAAEGLWLYCVTAGGEPSSLDGVASGRGTRAIGAAGLTAVVSSVPLSEFGEDGLKRNLNDLQWLEQVARSHENVLERTLQNGPVIPMRLCTIYRSEKQIQALLAERREEFTEALASLNGRGEWGVKITADRDRVAERLRARADQKPAGVGGAYLGRKQEELRLRDEVDASLDAAVQESHARLEEWAVASELLPPQRAELSGHSGEMVLNGAYLVDDERLDGFRSVVEELERQYGYESGLSFELTGPWPPYNFVGGAS